MVQVELPCKPRFADPSSVEWDSWTFALSVTDVLRPLLHPVGLVEEAGRTQILPQRGSQLGEAALLWTHVSVHLPFRAGQLWPQFEFCLPNP